MVKFRQIAMVSAANFRRWRRNPQILLAFGLGFIVCFLLSDKVILFSQEHDTYLQILEPFIWTFGDADSILTVSLLLLLLFADMPNIGNDVPLFLIRIDRTVWILGQILYLALATFGFLCFILIFTCILSGTRAYTANLWSDTAAILGYSEIGSKIAVPAFVKVLELSFPYSCAVHIFGLMLGYSLLMSGLILYLNLWKENLGMIGGIVFSGFGFLMNPEVIASLFHFSQQQMNLANIAFGWISPLNHATYYMHNFGYDNLPGLWVAYVFFGVGSAVLFGFSFRRIKTYSFRFTGTQT